jgi:ABC-type Fe3+ transport system permease subunit
MIFKLVFIRTSIGKDTHFLINYNIQLLTFDDVNTGIYQHKKQYTRYQMYIVLTFDSLFIVFMLTYVLTKFNTVQPIIFSSEGRPEMSRRKHVEYKPWCILFLVLINPSINIIKGQ